MNKIVPLFLVLVVGYIGYQLFLPSNKIKMKHSPETYFKSKKVQKLCYALIQGDLETADNLIKKGIDVNTVGDKVEKERKNGYTPTPLTWLFLANKETLEKRQAFKFLLDNGADSMVRHNKYGTTMLHEAAGYEHPDYLKMILDSENFNKEDLNDDKYYEEYPNTFATPLLHAMSVGRFENFKLLLDAGAAMNWKESGELRDSTLVHCSMNGVWKFGYELLVRDANYESDLQRMINTIESTGGAIFSAETSINFRSVDYRQKVIQFFRAKGIEINPAMNKDEKYITENGEDVFYVNEGINYKGDVVTDKNNEWIKFIDSARYEGTIKDPDTQEYLDKTLN